MFGLRIYVAGPYTSSTAEGLLLNTERAIDAGIALMRKGHAPYIPHLTHFVDNRAKEIGVSIDWQDYVDWDLEWLKVSDALLFLGSSKGADLELAEARRLGKAIFRSLDEVPAVENRRSA